MAIFKIVHSVFEIVFLTFKIYSMFKEYSGGFFYIEQFSVPWRSVHSVHLCKRTEVNTFLFPSLIHFSACQSISNEFHLWKNVALMLMQVLIQYISDMENEFMAWFHVFFLDYVIEIGQAAHGLFRETSHT